MRNTGATTKPGVLLSLPLRLCLWALLIAPALGLPATADTPYRLVGTQGGNCAIEDRGVRCWGSFVSQVPQLNKPLELITSTRNACALDDTGSGVVPVCWGNQTQLIVNMPEDLSDLRDLAIHSNSARGCAIESDGELRCWGPAFTQPPPGDLNNPTQVALTSNNGCVIDGLSVRCWGATGNGILSVPTLTRPVEIQSGRNQFCVLDDTGTGTAIVCWGALAGDPQPSLESPVAFSVGHSDASDRSVVCALDDRADGQTVLCWGDSGGAAVPDGLGEVLQLATGRTHACALERTDRGAQVICWGSVTSAPTDLAFADVDDDQITDAWESYHGLDTADPDDAGLDLDGDGVSNLDEFIERSDPADRDQDGISDIWEMVNGLDPNNPADAQSDSDGDSFTALQEFIARTSPQTAAQRPGSARLVQPGSLYRLAGAQAGNCTIEDTGVRCWGNFISSVPTLVAPIELITSTRNACALDDTGSVIETVCWGNPTQLLVDMPEVLTDVRALAIHSASARGCAIEAQGSLSCWGPTFPEALPNDLVGATQLALTSTNGCVIDDLGVRCWGADLNGQLDVPAFINPLDIQSGRNQFCVLDDTGDGNAVVCWGAIAGNPMPELEAPVGFSIGHSDASDRSVACALDARTDGERVVCWGDSTAADVPAGLGEVLQLATGRTHACALERTARGAETTCWGSVQSAPTDLAYADVDNDQLGDAWESYYDLDTADPGDAGLDLDNDGVSNLDEFKARTDPADADRDGISDVWEVANGLDPTNPADAMTDADDDTFSALDEYTARTSPILAEQRPGSARLVQPGSRYRLAGTQTGGCVIEDIGARCWGSFATVVPELVNPLELVTSTRNACALDDTGNGIEPVCWGNQTILIVDMPNDLTDLRALAIHSQSARGCAIDQSGALRCWGTEFPQALPDNLVNPTQVALTANNGCVIDDLKVRCWGNAADGLLDVPEFNNPLDIQSGRNQFCVLDDTGTGNAVVCWGALAGEPIPNLESPVGFSIGHSDASDRSTACALDDRSDGQVVVCWGDATAIEVPPDLGEVLQLATGRTHACALERRQGGAQVTCWGSVLAPPQDFSFEEQIGTVSAVEFATRQPQWRWRSIRDGTGLFRHKLDDSNLTTGSTETTSLVFVPEQELAEGEHTLYVEEQLPDGSWASVGSAVLIVDRTAPKPGQIINSSGGSFSVDLSCSDLVSELNCEVFATTNRAAPPNAFTSLGQAGRVAFTERETVRYFTRDPLGNQSSVFTVEGQTTSELTFELTAQSIEQTDELAADGAVSSGLANIDLSGFDIVLEVESPDGQVNKTAATTQTDFFGRYAFDNLQNLLRDGSGIPAGTYGFTTRFSGTSVLQSADSGRRQVLVGRPAGYAVILQGRIAGAEGQASHKKTANRIYRTLLNRGFEAENLRYFAYPDSQDGNLPILPPSVAGLREALLELGSRMNTAPAPFYLVLVDHGTGGLFHVSENETITPSELNSMLQDMEAAAGASVRSDEKSRVVVLGFCYSGEFVRPLAAPGRVVIASAASSEESYRGVLENDGIRVGEFFLEELFAALAQDNDLHESFVQATAKTESFTRISQEAARRPPFFDLARQHPLLEDSIADGRSGSNELTENFGDGVLSRKLFLGVAGRTNNVLLQIIDTTPTRYLAHTETDDVLFASANNNAEVLTSIRIEIREPDLTLDPPDDNRNVSLQRDVENPVSQRRTALTQDPRRDGRLRWELRPEDAFSFVEPGKYEVFYIALERDTGRAAPSRRSVVYKNRSGNLPPDPFDLLLPEDDARVRTESVFTWRQTMDSDDLQNTDNVTYNLVISTDMCEPVGDLCEFPNDSRFSDVAPAPGTFLIAEEIANGSFAVDASAGLIDGQTYFWKVEAVDGFGARRDSSEVRTFTTDNSNTFAGPDLLVVQSTLDKTVYEGSGINLSVEIKNLDAVFNLPAIAVRLNTLVPDGIVTNDLPTACEHNPPFVTCDIGDLPERSTRTINIPMVATRQGRKTVTSFVSSYLSAERLREQADDNIQNNVDDLNLQVLQGEDTDNDGLPDAFEEANNLNPNDPSDAGEDLDGDGRTNLEEYLNGTGVQINERETNEELIDRNVMLVSSLLPLSRSVQVGSTATAFVTILNAGTVDGLECRVEAPRVYDPATGQPTNDAPVEFFFSTTDVQNEEQGARDASRDIAPGGAQSFVIGIRPLEAFDALEIALRYRCRNSDDVALVPGVNTLLLSASPVPVADIVALSATPQNDGTVRLSGESPAGAFATATVNLGDAAAITATADTGEVPLPVTLTICQTDPSNGNCISPSEFSVTTDIAPGATPTFAVFAFGQAESPIAFDPGNNRVYVRFRDADGNLRGATSVAIATTP